MESQRRIYPLHDLSPEVRAVTFAKCSRSPEPFDVIAAGLTDAKSAEFHEKWVVGYGHSSVAEHAVLSMAFENISILATKVIEDTRLASYTEKSTRYQIFTRDKCYYPEKIMKSELKDIYQGAINALFDTYEKIEPLMLGFIKEKYPQKPGESDLLYKSITKSRTCDNIRYLLPAATLTSLGMTANARVFARFLVKMLSHPLSEMQEIGEEAKARGLEEVPTLLKFLEANKYLQNSTEVIKQMVEEKLSRQPLDDSQPVVLIDYDKNALNKIIAALLYRESQSSYKQSLAEVTKWSDKAKEEFLDKINKDRAGFDQLLREFEHAYYTFDILLDFGAFRDIQRTRMATQTNQRLTIKHGYEIPNDIIELGFRDEYIAAMDKAREAFEKISQVFPEEAQYVVPLAFRKRVLMTWNLRELSHFIPLRSGPKGHQSYRRIAQKVWDELHKVQPLLAKYINVDKTEATVSWAAGMYKEEYNYDPNAARAKLKKNEN